jgi:hypothetical protein
LVAEVTVDQLRSVLAERRDQLAALPGVVGWGVGVGVDGQPTIQLFVTAPPADELDAELGRLFDRFEVIVQSGPAEAQLR